MRMLPRQQECPPLTTYITGPKLAGHAALGHACTGTGEDVQEGQRLARG